MTSITFVVSTSILIGLCANDFRLYPILYRITLSLFVVKIWSTCALLLFYRFKLAERVTKVYREISQRNNILNDLMFKSLVIMMVLISTSCGALIHAVVLNYIESEKYHFIFWSLYRFGAALYVLMWSIQIALSTYNNYYQVFSTSANYSSDNSKGLSAFNTHATS